VAHGFQLGDEPALMSGRSASFVEVVAAEIGVGDPQNRVSDRDDGPRQQRPTGSSRSPRPALSKAGQIPMRRTGTAVVEPLKASGRTARL
jgi:hypothetical protein